MKRNVEHHIFQLTLPTSNQWEQHRQILSYALKAAQRFFSSDTKIRRIHQLKLIIIYVPHWSWKVWCILHQTLHYDQKIPIISWSTKMISVLPSHRHKINIGEWQNLLFQSSCCCLVANVVWFPCWTFILQPHPLSYILYIYVYISFLTTLKQIPLPLSFSLPPPSLLFLIIS